jgi:hypothetical protein
MSVSAEVGYRVMTRGRGPIVGARPMGAKYRVRVPGLMSCAGTLHPCRPDADGVGFGG